MQYGLYKGILQPIIHAHGQRYIYTKIGYCSSSVANQRETRAPDAEWAVVALGCLIRGGGNFFSVRRHICFLIYGTPL